MKKILFGFSILLFVIYFTSACSASIESESTPTLLEPTPSSTLLQPTQKKPTSTLLLPPEATLSSEIENACVQSIEKFLQVNPCEDWEEYHSLIYPESPYYLATPRANNDPSCDLIASTSILKIMPAAEYYQGYVPGVASPKLPNEYVFYVEYKIEWQPGMSPVVGNDPFRKLIWTVYDIDTGKCLINTLGN